MPGYGRQRVCTLRPLANKEANGSFVYDDYADDMACGYAPENVHAEVNLYYHVDRIYDLITAPEVGVFDQLPGRHDVDGRPVPLTVVASYRWPTPADAAALAPATVAFFTPHEHLDMGMDFFDGLLGVPGDVLVFGQGETADFAYEAETVYHEFGHAVVNATAALGQVFADEQGLTNQPRALNEGIANTFAFLGSDDHLLGTFLTACTGLGFEFDAANPARFPDDLIGHPVADGDPVVGASYDLYRAFVDEWGGTRAGFIRVLLLALQDLSFLEGKGTFAAYAEALLARLATEGHADHVSEAEALLDAHGLRGSDREVDLTGASAADHRPLFMGCAIQEPWNTWMRVDLGSGAAPLATSYLRHRLTVPAGATTVTLSARLARAPSAMTEPGNWDYRLLVRRAGPIAYTFDANGVATASQDEVIEAVITPGQGGASALATWTIAGLAGGSTLHLQFVNLGLSEGVLADLAVE